MHILLIAGDQLRVMVIFDDPTFSSIFFIIDIVLFKRREREKMMHCPSPEISAMKKKKKKKKTFEVMQNIVHAG
jgi:hypothetical protein